MTKKKVGAILLVTAVLAAAVLVVVFLLPSKEQKIRPNIVLLSIDTLRADHLSCYGYPLKTTPHIDQYSKDFVLFESAISQAPVTSQSHMSLFTGLTPIVHEVQHWGDGKDRKRLDDSIPTLAEVLKDNGYITIGLHGGGNVTGPLGFDKGFDVYSKEYWYKPEGDSIHLTGIQNWIKKSKEEEKPLFLFLHHYLCHDPYVNAPEKFLHRFLTERVEGLPIKHLESDYPFTERDKFWENVDLSKESHRKHIISLYNGGVYYSDYIFGRLIKLLKKEEFYHNTIVILLSDHGEEFYEHGDYLHKWCFIETLHVPFLIKFPESQFGGSRIKKQVRIFDLMPTLLQHMEIEVTNFMQAISLLPLLTGEGEYDPQIISASADLRHIRFQEKKYTYYDQKIRECSEWLYDRNIDPRERNNLAEKESQVLERMKNLGKKIMQAEKILGAQMNKGEKVPAKLDEKTREQLKALGYIK
jgi:arylsulfatase A-like enzyme